MQSKALELIEWSQWFLANVREKRDFRWQHMQECQDELRRLHALNQELLEALQEVVQLWDHHCQAHGDGKPTPLHVKARAAIAKAEGQQ